MQWKLIIIIGLIVVGILGVWYGAYLSPKYCTNCPMAAAPRCEEGQEIVSQPYKQQWFCMNTCTRPVCQ
ncbi:hypothetical protein HYW21_01025 [Candidatus Woesearchaeota archaeon]|nr:hypothetical protein [Candidatus Woesearchaeota archaeon]